MLEYYRIDVSEGIYINKTEGSHECVICHYWYFLMINFRFQPKVCDGCHDMTQKSMSSYDVVVVTIGENNCRIHFWFMAKSKAVDRMKNADRSEKEVGSYDY